MSAATHWVFEFGVASSSTISSTFSTLNFRLVVSEPFPKLAYIIFELESYIGIYTIDEESGALTEKEMVQLLPNPASTDYAAEIEICSDKKFLYASNRKTDDSNGAIVVFEIKNDGSLERIQVQPVMGSTPRHFKVSMVISLLTLYRILR